MHSWNGSYEGRVLQSSMGMESGSQCIHGMGHVKAEYYRVLYMGMESGSQCGSYEGRVLYMGMESGSQWTDLNHLKKFLSRACLVPLAGEHCSGFSFTASLFAPPPVSCDLASVSLSSVDSLSHTFSVTEKDTFIKIFIVQYYCAL